MKRLDSPHSGSPLSPSEVLAGTFGEYQLTGSSLGSGGFGSVLEAIDMETGGSLAVKTMERRSDARDAKIRHEIEIMKWLSSGMAHGRKPMERSASEPCLASAAHPMISLQQQQQLLQRRGGLAPTKSSSQFGLQTSVASSSSSSTTTMAVVTPSDDHHKNRSRGRGGSTSSMSAHRASEAMQLSQSFRPHTQKFFNGHITAIRDCVFTPERVHIVMNAAKCNLADHISSKGRLREPEARGYFRQLVSAVSFCHSMGVCHRDIKLENVLIGKDGQSLEIADFGLSKFVDPTTFQCSSVCGTPKYIAPEIILRKHYDGRKSDVWACGVVLFAMLNGRLPFHGFKLRSLRSWAAFVDIASKMSNGRYRALIRAQFVTTSGRASSPAATTPNLLRSSSSVGSTGSETSLGSRTRDILCSSGAQHIIQDMLTFTPEQRPDTDELSFHAWLHPDEDEGVSLSAGTTHSSSSCSSLSGRGAIFGGGGARGGHARGASARQMDGFSDDNDSSSSTNNGSLSRTRRAVAHDAPAWAPDASAKECTGCGRGFNLFRRRHHCRRCGLIFCNACAAKRVLADLPENVRDFVPVRAPGEVDVSSSALAGGNSVEGVDDPRAAMRVCNGCCGDSPAGAQ